MKPRTYSERVSALQSVRTVRLAQDRSVRSYDADGRLRVETAVLTRACPSPYLGAEVPNGEDLGLDPARTYWVMRPLDELRKALSKFNSLPLLSEHIPVSPDDHQPDKVIGATGGDAKITGDVLTNSLVVWSRDGIDQIESGAARALSCGYRYTATTQGGVFDGQRFDLTMENIEPNHLTICPEGRVQGALVGDAALKINRYIGKFVNDMSNSTEGGGIDALCKYLMSKGFTSEEIAEVRALMGGDDPEVVGDDPPPFSGRPQVGGKMDEIMRTLAQDAINRARKKQADDFYARHPNAARLRKGF